MKTCALLRRPGTGLARVLSCIEAKNVMSAPTPMNRLLNLAAAPSFPSTTCTPSRSFSLSRQAGFVARRSVACAASFANASCHEASELVQGGSHAYLDVRTPEEFTAGHPPGAVNVPVLLSGPAGMSPNSNFLAQVTAAFPDKEAALCVGCAAGKRSEMACRQMSEAGYGNLVNVEGGFQAWAGSGLPIEK